VRARLGTVTKHVPIRDKNGLSPAAPISILARVHSYHQETTMAKSTRAIPEGHHSVTPSIMVAGAAKAIDFYKKALGAEELSRFPGPDGSIMHAEIRIGDSPIMLGDEMPEQGAKGPKAYGGTPVSL